MLYRVPPYVIYCAVAGLSFLIGDRIEPMFEGRSHAAEARAIATAGQLRMNRTALLNSGPAHNDAIQAGAATPAPAIAEATPVPEAEDAMAAKPEQEKPSIVTGTDTDSNTDFVEMKDLPVVEGQGGTDATPGRDVDVIGDGGVPVPEKGETDKASKSAN